MRRVWHCNTYCWFIRKLVFYYGERPTLVWYVKRATASTGPWTMALVITFVLGMLRRWSAAKRKIVVLEMWFNTSNMLNSDLNFFFCKYKMHLSNKRDSEFNNLILIFTNMRLMLVSDIYIKLTQIRYQHLSNHQNSWKKIPTTEFTKKLKSCVRTTSSHSQLNHLKFDLYILKSLRLSWRKRGRKEPRITRENSPPRWRLIWFGPIWADEIS